MARVGRGLRRSADVSAVIKSELKDTLAEDFNFLKCALKKVKSEIVNNTMAIRSVMDNIKATISEMEEGLSTWSGEVRKIWLI